MTMLPSLPFFANCTCIGAISSLKMPAGLRRGGALLAAQRERVLVLARDVVALGDDLGGLAHAHVDARPRVEDLLADDAVGVHLALAHRDALDAAADRRGRALLHDLVRGHRDGLEARRAEAVDGRRRRRSRAGRRRAPRRARCSCPGRLRGSRSRGCSPRSPCGSSWGTWPSAALMAWLAISSGRVALNEPRYDLARPVRLLATMTASRMKRTPWNRGSARPCPGGRPSPAGGPYAEAGGFGNDGGRRGCGERHATGSDQASW